MAHHDVRFPECIEIGATGGPRFKTTVIVLGSGHEKRNIEWARARGAWDISSGVKTAEDMATIISFFYARQGRAHSFRFRDWTDYHIGTAAVPLVIGTGDGTTVAFQLAKRYSSGGYYFARKISRPVSGTVLASTNESPTRTYSVDYSTGIITFTTPPGAGAIVSASGEYDLPVRFDQDELDVVGVFDGVQNIPSIRIVEIRE